MYKDQTEVVVKCSWLSCLNLSLLFQPEVSFFSYIHINNFARFTQSLVPTGQRQKNQNGPSYSYDSVKTSLTIPPSKPSPS